MQFLVITHVLHKKQGDQYFAYAPYVREMNLWFKYVDEVVVVAPLQVGEPGPIDLAYVHGHIRFKPVPAFHFTSLKSALQAIGQVPRVVRTIWTAMRQADHIHLRCPGNMGLLGCLVQVLFPGKRKTAKYAGNWDPASRQPWSYRLQRSILRNTFLTRNIQTLVYGYWPDANRNIRPFFTASYSAAEIEDSPARTFEVGKPLRLLFVGGLHAGKRPLLALQATYILLQRGLDVRLDCHGEGRERRTLETFIRQQNMEAYATLHGNADAETVKKAYQNSHFLVFASQSEGWPKAVAEAMFWGCVPVTTAVSCVPEMLGGGERGDLVAPDAGAIAERIVYYLQGPDAYRQKADKAMQWSRQYTLERFEVEIEKLLHA